MASLSNEDLMVSLSNEDLMVSLSNHEVRESGLYSHIHFSVWPSKAAGSR
jgi:hypothetical protein